MRAMRKYILPLTVFAAIGAVIVILARWGDEPDRPDRDEPVEKAEEARQPPPRNTKIGAGFQGNTSLEEHEWLRELERSLAREDLSHAYTYRGKVCEDLETILADRKLTRNLLDAIRKYGVESDDLKRRDVVLPILRVLKHPEATAMISGEYYKAKNEDERMMLLEAMSHEYHDPAQASEWAVERALNSESAEHRFRAWEVIKEFSNDRALLFETSRQIYLGTTRTEQRGIMVRTMSEAAVEVPAAKKWARKQMLNPKPDEIGDVVGGIDAWGDENDADRLDVLAVEFPDMAEFLKDRASSLRRELKMRAGEEPEPPKESDLPKPPEEPIKD